MYYAITTHLDIERDTLITKSTSELISMAADAGDVLSANMAKAIIECAKENKKREEEEAAKEAEMAAKKATRKYTSCPTCAVKRDTTNS